MKDTLRHESAQDLLIDDVAKSNVVPLPSKRQRLRLKMLANGFTPLPDTRKGCFLPEWSDVEVTEATIAAWELRKDWPSTGLRTGNDIVAIDIDVLDESLADEIHAKVRELCGGEPPVRIGRAPKRLLLVRGGGTDLRKVVSDKFEAPDKSVLHQVEILTNGQQFVAFGIHPKTERRYEWEDKRSPLTMTRDDLPRMTVKQLRELVVFAESRFEAAGLMRVRGGARTDGKAHTGKGVTGLPLEVLKDALMSIPNEKPADYDGHFLRFGLAMHEETGGSDEGFEVFRAWAEQHEDYDLKTCRSVWPKHSGKGTPDAIAGGTIFKEALKHGWKFPAMFDETDFDDLDDDDDWNLLDDLPDPAPKSPSHKKRPLPEWRGFKPMRTSDGDLIPNLASAVWGLGNALERNGWTLRHNEFTRRNECNGIALDDASASLIRVAIQQARLGLEHIGKQTCDEAIELGARADRYHPIRDDLNALRWDGGERLSSFLPRYFGAPENDYARGVGRAFLIAMVARVMQPGCKHDCALIFVGSQGARKSTAAKILAGGEEWFSESMPKITEDGIEARRHLPGKWIVEIGEMSALAKADVNAIKSFLSGTFDDVRFPYARRDEKVARECVFIGTANNPQCLRDETGNRRFWPVAVGEIDIEALQRDRDQLLAEAVHAYRAGEQWWLTPELDALAKVEQETARDADVWEDPIKEWLQRGESAGDDFENDAPSQPYQRVKLAAVLKGALGIETARQGRADQNRASAVLRSLGWTRKAFEDGKYWIAPACDPRLTHLTQD